MHPVNRRTMKKYKTPNTDKTPRLSHFIPILPLVNKSLS